MRGREIDAAVAAANPLGRERLAGLELGADRTALLDAVAHEPLPGGSGRRRGSGRNLALAILIAVVSLALASVFTAPGRAVAGWVGERLGLSGPGEPGGPPALRQLNESWALGSSLKGQPQYVLLVGPVTGRERSRYEFITYRPAPHPEHPTWPDGPCFKLDLTQVRSMSTQGCGVLPKGRQFTYLGVAGGYDHAVAGERGVRFVDELNYLSGRVGPEVATVEATVKGREIPVQVRPVPAELRERFGLGGPFSFFVGFFSGVPRGGTVEVTARRADGSVAGHARTELMNRVLGAKMTCRMMLDSSDHVPEAGRRECEAVLGRGGR